MKTPREMMRMGQVQRLSLFSLLLLVNLFLAVGCIRDVTGQKFEPGGPCWGGTKDFSYSGPLGCDDAESFGEDENGAVWRFSNSCIGDDLTPVNSPGAYPKCPSSGNVVEVMVWEVDVEAGCYHSASSSGAFVGSDDPCLSDDPIIYDSYPNKQRYCGSTCCGFKHTSTVFTADEAVAMEPCPDTTTDSI